MTLGRGAVLCWRLVQTVALIAYCGCGMLRGRPGRPVDLVTGNFGAVEVLIYFRAIRAVGRSDCSDVLCKGLMDFETLKFCFDLIVRATEAVDRSDFSNVELCGILQD